MKRLVLLVIMLLLALAAPAPPPAAAHTDACFATGSMTLSTGFGLAGFTSNTANFWMSFTVGACASGGTETWSGTITGACSLATGTGTTHRGHDFSFTTTAEVMVMSGEVTGIVKWNVDPTGGSCTNKTATRFFVTGTWAQEDSEPPPPNYPPYTPTQLAPAAGHEFAPTASQTFTIQTADPEGDRYAGRIDVRTASGPTVATYYTNAASSGSTVSVTGSPLPAGSYEWAATATDDTLYAPAGSYSPRSPWQPFTVANLPIGTSGTGYPSDDCAGGSVLADSFAGGTYTRVHTRQPDPSTTWVCYRTEGAGVMVGGKLIVTSPGATTPGIPSTDTDASVCASRPGNAVPGPHPTLAGSVGDPADPSTYVPFFTDVHATTSAATLCLGVGTTGRQVTVPLPQGATPPSITTLSDQAGTHRPTSPVNAAPVSGACQAATTGTRAEYVNASGALGRVWLHSWQESATRTHVCVRVAGVTTTGGRLTVDTTGVPGAMPYLTTSTTDTAACALRVAGIDSPTTVELRRSTSVTDPSAASFCVVVGGTRVRVTTGVTGSATAPQATWLQDP